MYNKDPIHCLAAELVHCSTGNQKGNLFLWTDVIFFKIPRSFFDTLVTKEQINRHTIIISKGCSGFLMICAVLNRIFHTS